jgi:hypothetical protein
VQWSRCPDVGLGTWLQIGDGGLKAVEGREVVRRYVVGRWVSADGRRSLGTMMGLTVCGGDAAGATSGTGAGGEAETTEQQ